MILVIVIVLLFNYLGRYSSCNAAKVKSVKSIPAKPSQVSEVVVVVVRSQPYQNRVFFCSLQVQPSTQPLCQKIIIQQQRHGQRPPPRKVRKSRHDPPGQPKHQS
ncbi:hypothetical protein M434DRAFT_288018 [Hypoxylon sp. CO27-5]|nr:hypothetical protein M434DRAFT_288018 [Hypoxylon sp. CO27-5]